MDCEEGMDTYAMANTIYVLLTGSSFFGRECGLPFSYATSTNLYSSGLWPFYQYDPDDSKFVQDLLIANKEKPFVDPRYRTRSRIEAGLVKIMEHFWEWDLEKRGSIFEMIDQLYKLRDGLLK
jgi:hypothetical protein